MCLKDDGLDPSYYVSVPGMFNDLLYKNSRAELKLMTNIDQYLMVENSIHRDMTIISYYYAKANNKKCSNYDSSKPKSWIMYEDMNTLYLDTMSQYMSIEILDKVDLEKILDIQSIVPDTEIGYMSEVDIKVPIHFHDFFANYLLALEKQIVSEN
ncbi:38983_t:CDS:1 [Gigaspora margarita]|uniref:38983_t:CDS:1 n=1 Tax=Gigaspora margarita TaxID=4874 RepID=A0ABN7WI30_GIGMA|nr:38983_t:CDS:1 [Gigaspora margarita]